MQISPSRRVALRRSLILPAVVWWGRCGRPEPRTDGGAAFVSFSFFFFRAPTAAAGRNQAPEAAAGRPEVNGQGGGERNPCRRYGRRSAPRQWPAPPAATPLRRSASWPTLSMRLPRRSHAVLHRRPTPPSHTTVPHAIPTCGRPTRRPTPPSHTPRPSHTAVPHRRLTATCKMAALSSRRRRCVLVWREGYVHGKGREATIESALALSSGTCTVLEE